ncbi:chemotaxis response regulator protein-glutamate methylesterase [Altererythrobacter sp. GH1-8]|uniref:protein-glutamate methylesterase/protein-glutamine glutaminase n=1 Tax=Altererythrobacter sp. GH1-8 TaxID=3349333 RepID=UPI00374C98AB
MSISVLIVDDSRFIQRVLDARLSRESDIEVVGYACDAQEARKMMRALDPDVVTLDVEMPGMDGLSFLQKIMELRPTPVIIVSGSTQAGTATTAKALQLGAVSCYAKDASNGGLPDDDGGELANLVRAAAQVTFGQPQERNSLSTSFTARLPAVRPELIVLGSSTGGVEALRQILPQLPAHCPPTVVVQHINASFASAIAQSLNDLCQAKMVLAENLTMLQPGHIYLAPGDERHLRVARCENGGIRLSLRSGEPISGHRPSVDALFHSAASEFGSKVLGALLTGMGQDGAAGLLAMKHAGAVTIAQDAQSSVVFGMPRAAIEMGAAQCVLPLTEISNHLARVSSL